MTTTNYLTQAVGIIFAEQSFLPERSRATIQVMARKSTIQMFTDESISNIKEVLYTEAAQAEDISKYINRAYFSLIASGVDVGLLMEDLANAHALAHVFSRKDSRTKVMAKLAFDDERESYVLERMKGFPFLALLLVCSLYPEKFGGAA